MSNVDDTQGDWTDAENDLIVADYLDMLRLELSGQSYVKAQRNAALRQIVKRSRGSVEFKHQNISAVLQRLGFPWINGYKPSPNFQKSLISAIERYYQSIMGVTSLVTQQTTPGFAESQELQFEEPPPKRAIEASKSSDDIERLVRKFDPAERDFRNRALGKQGEEMVFNWERTRLFKTSFDLAKKVRWVSRDDGDGAGFDILSFESDGRERLIEVKTTVGGQSTPFYISRNEVDLSCERPEAFKLVRLYDFSRTPRAFELSPPLHAHVNLEPNSFIAKFA
jgi:hypothetical protein